LDPGRSIAGTTSSLIQESTFLDGFWQHVTAWRPGRLFAMEASEVLIASYLYGTWRLGTLGGPSVEEFKPGAEPPWEGQQRGF
jgi:hypothetical protein